MVGFRSGDSHFLQQNAQFGQLNVIPSLPPTNEVCEGYVFTGVCLSTGGSLSRGSVWGGSLSGGSLSGGGLCPGRGLCHGDPPLRQCAGGTHPTGMHSCLIHDFIFWGVQSRVARFKEWGCDSCFDEEDHLCISKLHKILERKY